LHWVSAAHAVTGEVRIYNHLFSRPDPGGLVDLLEGLNPQSEEVVSGCRLEGSLAGLPAGTLVQFARLGYFCVDRDTTEAMPVFNRTVTLRDAWAKVQAKVKP
jgi:glutaminyl-tRNA synthetase